jgi:hypothetical protein
MTDALSDRVSECYHRAAECRERATHARSPSLQATFLKLEKEWLDLARRCQLDESTYRLSAAARYFRERRGGLTAMPWR